MLFYEQKNVEKMIEALLEMHKEAKAEPQTLSEISFYQKYGLELQLAESWINRYQKVKDETSLNQAWDIYRNLFLIFREQGRDLKKVQLQNAAPKLLLTKNSELSVPGLYMPNKPIIRIAAFAPTL